MEAEMNVNKMFDMKGKVAVVTGGAGHLGAAMSKALAEAGADVYIASLNGEKRNRLIEEFYHDSGLKMNGIFLDFRNP